MDVLPIIACSALFVKEDGTPTHQRAWYRRVDGWRGILADPFPSVPLRTVRNSFPLHGSPVIIVRVVCVLAFQHEWLDDIHDRQSASFVAGPPSLVSIVAFLPVLVS